MKILCLLDSEHYTDPEFIRVSDNTPTEDLREYIEDKLHQEMSWEKGKAHEGTLEWESDERVTCREMIGDDEFFIVCEVKSLPDHDYITAYHHAYEGVDFTVYGFDSIEEAREFSNMEADEFKENIKVFSDQRGINSITLDDENQWHHWESQLIFETTIKSKNTAA